MQGIILVLGLMIVAGMLLRLRWRRDHPTGGQARTHARPHDPHGHHERQAEEQRFKHNLDQLLVELSETSREMLGRLDTKLHLLNRLIQEADERIAALQRCDAGPAPPAPAARAAAPARAGGEARPETQERVERILELAAKGLTAVEIAHQSGAPRGEVELVLSLHPRRSETASGPPSADPAAGLGPSEMQGILGS